jgi:hypothetical protein
VTRRDAVWSAAFALAAKHPPHVQFTDVPLEKGEYRVERREFTDADREHRAREAERAAALFDAWEGRPK